MPRVERAQMGTSGMLPQPAPLPSPQLPGVAEHTAAPVCAISP